MFQFFYSFHPCMIIALWGSRFLIAVMSRRLASGTLNGCFTVGEFYHAKRLFLLSHALSNVTNYKPIQFVQKNVDLRD